MAKNFSAGSIVLLFLVVFIFVTAPALGQKSSKAEVVSLNINSFGTITWLLKAYGYEKTEVKQLKNGKWLLVGAIEAFPYGDKGTLQTYKDSVRVKFHKGLNRYKIKIFAADTLSSEEVLLDAKVSNDDGSLWIVNNEILLDIVEDYQVMDSNGKTVLKGRSNKIAIADLTNGTYLLGTSNGINKFIKE